MKRRNVDNLVVKIDELFYIDNAYNRGYHQGILHGHLWMQALKGDGNFPKEQKSEFRRLMKHYMCELKRLSK